MKKFLIVLITLSTLLCKADSEKAILSDNRIGGLKPNAFPAESKSITTGATYNWVTEGEYKTDEETLKTGKRLKVLFDGNNGSYHKSRTYSKWRKGNWATVIIDFKKPYLITDIDLWSLHEKSRDTESAEILVSADNSNYTTYGLIKVDPTIPHEKKKFIKSSFTFPKPVKGQFIKLRIRKRKGASQQQLGEIIIWGKKNSKNTNYLEAGEQSEVTYTISGIQSGALKLDWSNFPGIQNKVKNWKIYSADQPFNSVSSAETKLWKIVPAKQTSVVIYPLTPGKKYYFGITAVYPGGEAPKVNCTPYTPPRAFACETFGDMLAINHFWGGGGARQKRKNQTFWEEIATEQLSSLGIKQIRWWLCSPNIVKKYYNYDMGLMAYGRKVKTANALGVHSFAGAANEPDLSGKPVESYVASQKKTYEFVKKQNPHNMVGAPSSGMEDSSLEWLEKFYELGGKDIYDVLDLHTYCKISGGYEVPEGYPKGSPEALFGKMEKINAIRKKYGETSKPLISTEFGYTDCNTHNPSGPMTPERKAQYLVRGLILHHILGFKRVFLYSFWDEGNDPHYTEHHFGLIDYDLQRKPSFYAVQNLAAILGNYKFETQTTGCSLPLLGYNFKSANSNERITVIWDGSGEAIGTFKTEDKEVLITDLYGKTRKLITNNGSFTLPIGLSPVYIKSVHPIKLNTWKRLNNKYTSIKEIKFNLAQNVFYQYPREKVSIPLNIENYYPTAINANILIKHKSKTVANKTIQLPPNTKSAPNIEFNTTGDKQNILQKLVCILSYNDEFSSYSEEKEFFIRYLTPCQQAVTQKAFMGEYTNPVYIISNPKIELSFDVHKGARVLDFIDKKTRTNQVNMNYNLIHTLESTPFAYGIWDKINGAGKNALYNITEAKDGKLLLKTNIKNIEVIKNWQLDKQTAKLDLKFTNNSANTKSLKYYIHPEYTVGGTGDSVTDVFSFPTASGKVKLPFWTGLGDKKLAKLTEGWWKMTDTKSNLTLKQIFQLNQWQNPRIWFGMGTYNVEMTTIPNSELQPNASWQTNISWQLGN